MKLRDIALARSGDKGDVVNVTVIPYREDDYSMLLETLVKRTFGDLVEGEVTRYELPGIHALNFVLRGALGGGVSASLRLDIHGKSFQSIMLETEI